MYLNSNFLVILIVLVDILAIYDVFKSQKGNGRFIFSALVLLLPIVGVIIYYLYRNSSKGHLKSRRPNPTKRDR